MKPTYGNFLIATQKNMFSLTDKDECTENSDNCHGNANCTNTIGSFNCTCKLGYSGDGVSCSGE